MTRAPKTPLKICKGPGWPGPPVLVVHSWWGLTSAFDAFGAVLAERGFLVGLADLYGGRTAADPQEAQRLRRAPRREPVYRTLIRNIEELQAFGDGAAGDIGVVGFSMGGHWAVWLSQRPELPIGATVLYYASRAGSFAGSRSAFLAHYAAADPWVSAAGRRRMERGIESAGRPYRAFDYPGTRHWFAESDRSEYAPEAAGLAFERTLRHLEETLRPRSGASP